MKDILVVTPTLGNRKSLLKTVDSVRAFGEGRVDHILVAPNKNLGMVRSIIGDDIHVEAEPEGSRGIYPALNYVFEKFGHDYKYLTFINDDDYWLPNYVSLINAADGKVGLVYGKVNYLVGEKVLPMSCSPRFPDFIPLLFGGIILFTQQAAIVRSDLYFRLGGFDETFKLAADTLFWAKLSLLEVSYVYVAKPCAMYEIQSGQLSSDRQTSMQEHERLSASLIRPSKMRICLAKLFFRMTNLSTYVVRALVGRKRVSDYMYAANR